MGKIRKIAAHCTTGENRDSMANALLDQAVKPSPKDLPRIFRTQASIIEIIL
ncbi:MAG: hypothetical protein VB137_05660 [Burkholderia sp.]